MEKETTKAYLIRMTPTLHNLAQKQADKMGLSFSAYVRMLVSKDTSDVNRP